MIYVRRRSVEPESLTSRIARAEGRRLRAFFTGPKAKRPQRRYDFRDELWQKSVGYLRSVFHAKCAYCESHLDKAAPTLVDHFRPLVRARDLDGTSSAPHYWWRMTATDFLWLAVVAFILGFVVGYLDRPRSGGGTWRPR